MQSGRAAHSRAGDAQVDRVVGLLVSEAAKLRCHDLLESRARGVERPAAAAEGSEGAAGGGCLRGGCAAAAAAELSVQCREQPLAHLQRMQGTIPVLACIWQEWKQRKPVRPSCHPDRHLENLPK